ncbi:hypothetical protein ZWY2020_040170 [Hordeum vulgare]|nr:hypothetical protein ZWY2020_040170 [Hordeum vulgare]
MPILMRRRYILSLLVLSSQIYRFSAIKINNTEGNFPRVVNGQRIKHYISGTPINVETNIINVITPKEYIRDVYLKRENSGSWNSGLEKEQILVHYSAHPQMP